MHPVLLDLGIFKLHTYGACMALGFLLALKVAERISGRKDVGNLMMCLLLSGVVGSRIAYVIERWKCEFAANPMSVVRIDRGGLVFYGGLVLAAAVFFAWCAVKRQHPLALADVLCVVLPLGHACGRVGCFFYGCCWGRISDSPLAVSFPRFSPAWHEQLDSGMIDCSSAASLPVLPAQLFEAGVLLLLFALLLFLYRRFGRCTAGVYLILYAAIRFALEFLRGDPRAQVLGMSIGQAISLFMALFGAVLTVAGLRAPRGERRPEQKKERKQSA